MSANSVDFHVKNNDYFGTLAAVISLVEQLISEEQSSSVDLSVCKKIVKDLEVLQQQYIIQKK